MTENEQKPKRQQSRITKAEKIERVDRIYKMRLSGASHADLIRFGSERWKIGERAIEKYITQADQAMKSASEVTRENLRDEYIAAMRLIISKSFAISDFKTVISAYQEIAKIRGLYAPPPPQYIQIMGVSEKQMKALGLAAQKADVDLGVLFDAMIAEIAAESERKNE